MWKPLLISALNHPYLLCPRGQAFPSQFLCSAQQRSEAGQETCSGRGFSHGPKMCSPCEGSLGSGEEHHGNTGQVPSSHLLTQTPPRQSTLLRECSRLYIYRASPHWSKQYRPTLCLELFWLLAFLSGKHQGLCHFFLLLFFFSFFFKKSPEDNKTDLQLKHLLA